MRGGRGGGGGGGEKYGNRYWGLGLLQYGIEWEIGIECLSLVAVCVRAVRGELEEGRRECLSLVAVCIRPVRGELEGSA